MYWSRFSFLVVFLLAGCSSESTSVVDMGRDDDDDGRAW